MNSAGPVSGTACHRAAASPEMAPGWTATCSGLRGPFCRIPAAPHVDVAAAGRGDVGEDLAAAPGHEPGDGTGLSGHLGSRVSATFMIVTDSKPE